MKQPGQRKKELGLHCGGLWGNNLNHKLIILGSYCSQGKALTFYKTKVMALIDFWHGI
jgi:hypothetical protein